MKRNRKIGSQTPALTTTTHTTVRFSEVDSMQVVWHGEYVRYFEYIVRRQSDGALVARGSSVQVFVDSEGNMVLNNPPFYEEWKNKWLTKE